MPTAGSFAARVAEVAVSNAASTDVTTATYVDVEKCNSPKFSSSLDSAESSSNDSGGSKEYLPTWDGGTMSFELIADEAATGQEHLWTSFLSKQIRAFRVRPKGNATTEKQIRFLGIITSIEESMDKGDVGKYSVSVQRTGAITRDNQP
jgi:hypothetical protein